MCLNSPPNAFIAPCFFYNSAEISFQIKRIRFENIISRLFGSLSIYSTEARQMAKLRRRRRSKRRRRRMIFVRTHGMSMLRLWKKANETLLLLIFCEWVPGRSLCLYVVYYYIFFSRCSFYSLNIIVFILPIFTTSVIVDICCLASKDFSIYDTAIN